MENRVRVAAVNWDGVWRQSCEDPTFAIEVEGEGHELFKITVLRRRKSDGAPALLREHSFEQQRRGWRS